MPEDANRLVTEEGAVIPGYLVPARAEALVLLHHVYGLNEHIRHVARRFAAEGFTVFAADLFNGRTAGDPAMGFQNAHLMSWKTAMEQIRQAVRALSAG